jgi:phosphoglycerol transferase
MASPLKGTGNGTMSLILRSCVPPVLVLMGLYVLFVWLICFRHRSPVWVRRIGAAFCVLLLLASLVNSYFALRIPAYLEFRKERTTIYEEYYISPDKVDITANGEKKNLIHIYLESMETTYASKEDGGEQSVNYMPLLTELAKEGISFSDGDGLGGFHSISGTGWTMGALMGITSGVPFSLSVSGEQSHNSMGKHQNFAKGLITLGDILEEQGYRQMFLCGSDADFAGRRDYFEQHGDYEIFDLDSAIDEGDVEKANDWWGFDGGIRPAVGYSCLPNHGLKQPLFQLLEAQDLGITLTENGAMLPQASVCGFYIANKHAKYF